MLRPATYTLFFCLILLAATITLETPAKSEEKISVITYQASKEGFMSNSHIVMAENEALLIDAQFSIVEARKAAELIKSTGKALTKILITHPHPDHYYGLEILGTEFSDVEIIGGPQTIEEITNTTKYWTNEEGEPLTFDKMKVLDTNNTFKHEDIDITYRIFKEGESVENTLLYIPSSHTLFIGDLASNGVHMWIGENRVDKWLAQLGEVRSIGTITKVYPGHGPPGGPEILEQAERYLLNFKETVESSKTIEEAIEKMKKLYPDYKMPEILEGSVRAVMLSENLKH